MRDMQAEYESAFDALAYDNASAEEVFCAIIEKLGRAAGLAECLRATQSLRLRCKACDGLGTKHGSTCFRCRGRGFQTWQDGIRNARCDAKRRAA